MRKTKHSKIRNTGLLFELLSRQVAADVLNKSNRNVALDIIKKQFNERTELGKELYLYNLLSNKKFITEAKANFFINEILNQRKKLNSASLKREKYNIIKQIKESFNVNDFFSCKVEHYKTYASIYNLFENFDALNPDEKTNTHFYLMEHVTKTSQSQTEEFPQQSSNKDLRILTYKILLEKFNQKYANLNNDQQTLLKEYINNVSNTNNFNNYVEKIVPVMKTRLKKFIPFVKEKIVKIKLTEATNSIDKLCKIDKQDRVVKDSVVIQTMRYMELLKELAHYAKKA
jgi:hypothetical protein